MSKTQNFYNVACLFSGGLDSLILLYYLSQYYKQITPIYVSSNLNYEKAEKNMLDNIIASLNISNVTRPVHLSLNCDDLYINHWSITNKSIPEYQSPDSSVYLPGRNILLFSKVAVWCSLNNISNIACGHLKGNPFSDASVKFIRSICQSISYGLNSKFTILRPFVKLTKYEIIKKYSYLPLDLSMSCINPKYNNKTYIHCGDCNKCNERIQAFVKAKINDKTTYEKK